jgi:hypothetical protein
MAIRSSRLVGIVAIGLAAFGAVACAGTISTRGTLVYEYPATYVETVPPGTVYQPRVYYRGRYAYLREGRWYYPTDRGWVVFREEPRELQRYRVNYQDRARYDYQYRSVPEHRYRYNAPEYRYRSPQYGSPPPTRHYHPR